MITRHRRLSLSLAVCITAGSFLAAQPALAGSNELMKTTAPSAPSVEQLQLTLTTLVQQILELLQQMKQSAQHQGATHITRG